MDVGFGGMKMIGWVCLCYVRVSLTCVVFTGT